MHVDLELGEQISDAAIELSGGDFRESFVENCSALLVMEYQGGQSDGENILNVLR